MGTLLLIRHGQASLFAADYDVLSERGRAQAATLGAHLGRQGFVPTAAYTGPAKRQRDTAALAAEAAAAQGPGWPAPTELPGLDEHDAFGMLQRVVPKLAEDAGVRAAQARVAAAEGHDARSGAFQHLFEAVMARWLAGDVSADDAETWPAFRARVDAALDTMLTGAASGARLVAFSSVGPIAVVLQRALGTSDLASFRTAWRCRNASIARFVFRGDALTLDAYNDLSHLPAADDRTFR